MASQAACDVRRGPSSTGSRRTIATRTVPWAKDGILTTYANLAL